MSPRDRPRIALVGPDPDAHGGVAGYQHALIGSSLGKRFELLPVHTHRDGGAAAKLGQAVRGLTELRRLCRAGEVDLVHLQSSWRWSLPRKAAALAIARSAGCPVVLQLHGSAFEQALRRRGLRGAAARAFAGRVARAADAVVAATPLWAADAGRLLGVDGVRVVPNTAEAVEPNGNGSGSGNGLRNASSNGTSRSATVLFLGRLTRAKGVFELVEAVASLRASHPEVRLVLAGAGRDEAAVRALADERGLGEAVELPGWVSGEPKRRLLASAACLALPSHAEGLPLAALEGLLAGLPVVATGVGGMPEAVRDGEEALLVPPHDAPALAAALDRVLGDRELAQRLAHAGRDRALAAFGPERVAAELGSLYEEVLARRAPATAGSGTDSGGAPSTTSSSQRSTE